MPTMKRRDFVKQTLLSVSLVPFFGFSNNLLNIRKIDNLSISIFSKHLQFLDYQAIGEMTAEMCFSGVDLTVRPHGHVSTESVKTDLPKAIQEIKKGGSNCKLITTSIENRNNPLDSDLLHTASNYGVKFYRTNGLNILNNPCLNLY